MTDRVLVIDGIEVPLHASLSFRQSYAPLAGAGTRRYADGAALKETAWSGKLITTLQCSGWIPAGLESVDWSATVVIRCVQPLSQVSAARVFTLPAARRSDSGYTPYGEALVAGNWEATGIGLVGDTATLDAVAGATAYRVCWFPQLTVFSDGPEQDLDGDAATYGWSLSAEEA